MFGKRANRDLSKRKGTVFMFLEFSEPKALEKKIILQVRKSKFEIISIPYLP